MKFDGKKMLGILLATALVVPAVTTSAQTPKTKPTKKQVVVVTIDMSRLFRESKIAKQIQSDFKAWDESYRLQGQPKYSLMQQKQKELQEGQAKLSPQDKEKLEKEVKDLQADLGALQAKQRQEFQEKQGAATAMMQEKMKPILDALAKENDWDVVMNRGDQNAIWTSDAIDQTDAVLAKLDQATPEAAPAAPAPQAPAPAAPQPKK